MRNSLFIWKRVRGGGDDRSNVIYASCFAPYLVSYAVIIQERFRLHFKNEKKVKQTQKRRESNDCNKCIKNSVEPCWWQANSTSCWTFAKITTPPNASSFVPQRRHSLFENNASHLSHTHIDVKLYGVFLHFPHTLRIKYRCSLFSRYDTSIRRSN